MKKKRSGFNIFSAFESINASLTKKHIEVVDCHLYVIRTDFLFLTHSKRKTPRRNIS